MFAFDPAEPIPDGVARVLDEVFADAERRLEAINSTDAAEIEPAVHQFRKRCKELRAVARLIRPALGPAFGRFNRLIRDASAELSAARDAHVMLETIDLLATDASESASLANIKDRQSTIAQRATAELQHYDHHQREALRLLTAARNETASWVLPDDTTPIAEGLERTYRRGRRDWRLAKRTPTDDHMHEWRKATKQLWFQTRLLEASDPVAMTTLTDDLDSLGTLLGKHNDLAVLIGRLERSEAGLDVYQLAREEQHKLRKKARRRGKRIFDERPTVFVERVMSGWDRAVAENQIPALPRVEGATHLSTM